MPPFHQHRVFEVGDRVTVSARSAAVAEGGKGPWRREDKVATYSGMVMASDDASFNVSSGRYYCAILNRDVLSFRRDGRRPGEGVPG